MNEPQQDPYGQNRKSWHNISYLHHLSKFPNSVTLLMETKVESGTRIVADEYAAVRDSEQKRREQSVRSVVHLSSPERVRKRDEIRTRENTIASDRVVRSIARF